MKGAMRLCTTLVIVVGGLFLGRSAIAYGDSATPTPTLTVGTPGTKPTGGHVLDLMMRAWLAAGSEHFVDVQGDTEVMGSIKTGWGGPQVGDIAFGANPPVFIMQGPTWRTKMTASGLVTKRGYEIQEVDQNLLAIKIGKTGWSCNRYFGYSSLPGSPLWDGTSPWGLDSRNLGLRQINGTSAWKIQIGNFAKPKNGAKPSTHRTFFYFVSATNYLPLEIRDTYAYTFPGGHGVSTLKMTLSNFGETVHVTLPPLCAKKK